MREKKEDSVKGLSTAHMQLVKKARMAMLLTR